MKKILPKIIVVVGPTASGKSEFAVKLAKKRNGEIVSVDSRQVYRNLNIGTGKVEGAWNTRKADGRAYYVYKGVRHHTIDFINPNKQYSVAQFKIDAATSIIDIVSRGKLPILCGGTGHFIDAVVFGQSIPEVPPNNQLRKELETKPNDALFSELEKIDPMRAQNIDRHNKRRLIRALEIIHATGKPIPKQKQKKLYEIEWIHLNPPREELCVKIEKRLRERLQSGMIEEIQTLHQSGLSWKRMEELGLEYRYVSRYIRGKLSYDEMHTQLLAEIKKYAKRQQTWFKKYKKRR